MSYVLAVLIPLLYVEYAVIRADIAAHKDAGDWA